MLFHLITLLLQICEHSLHKSNCYKFNRTKLASTNRFLTVDKFFRNQEFITLRWCFIRHCQNFKYVSSSIAISLVFPLNSLDKSTCYKLHRTKLANTNWFLTVGKFFTNYEFITLRCCFTRHCHGFKYVSSSDVISKFSLFTNKLLLIWQNKIRLSYIRQY